MANIREYTELISKAVYGEEVRGSIVDALNAMNDQNNGLVEEVEDKARELIPYDYSQLSESIEDIEKALSAKKNLVTEIMEGYIRSNNEGNVSTPWRQDGYVCAVADVKDVPFISINGLWANNSFGFFTNDEGVVIGGRADSHFVTGYNSVYEVPEGATKLYFSFNVAVEQDKYDKRGYVVIADKFSILSDVFSINTFGYNGKGVAIYIDDMKFISGKDMRAYIYETEQKITDINNRFTRIKNLCTGINTEKYYTAWNVGDTPTLTKGNENNACGFADVRGVSKISINNVNISGGFSHFCGEDGKKLYPMSDYRIGNTSVYTVPDGVAYAYVTVNDKSGWSGNGLVILATSDDIIDANTIDYPYGLAKYFADGLKLTNGDTIGAMAKSAKHTYYVEKDGSGDFTKLTDAIAEATKYMDSIVYVGNGTWDLIDEVGVAYIEATPAYKGVVLKNRVHLIFSSKAKVLCKYEGTNAIVKQEVSAFNTGTYGFTIENADIESDNVRYTVHDEMGYKGSEPYINRYLNCRMKHTNGKYVNCIGGGLGIDGYIEIRGCYFEGDFTGQDKLVYYHGNNETGIAHAKSTIEVHDSYFAGSGTFGVLQYGDSTEESHAYVSGNSLGSPLMNQTGSYSPHENVKMIAWGNEVRS